MEIKQPKNISIDFDRYQKKFDTAKCLTIEDGIIKVSEGYRIHIYNWDKVNSVDFDV